LARVGWTRLLRELDRRARLGRRRGGGPHRRPCCLSRLLRCGCPQRDGGRRDFLLPPAVPWLLALPLAQTCPDILAIQAGVTLPLPLASAARLADVHRLVSADASYALQAGVVACKGPRGRQPFPLVTFGVGHTGIFYCPDNGPPRSLPEKDMEVATMVLWPFEADKRYKRDMSKVIAPTTKADWVANPDHTCGMYHESQATAPHLPTLILTPIRNLDHSPSGLQRGAGQV
jgi:hypothetical protein